MYLGKWFFLEHPFLSLQSRPLEICLRYEQQYWSQSVVGRMIVQRLSPFVYSPPIIWLPKCNYLLWATTRYASASQGLARSSRFLSKEGLRIMRNALTLLKAPSAMNTNEQSPLSPAELLGDKKVHNGPPKTPEERQAALREALAIDPGPEKWGWAAIQLYLITLVVCCCSGDSGFDSTVMGGINTMEQYLQYFGLPSVGSKTSIVFGIFTIGSICGMIPASYLPDKYGRRMSMFFGNAVLIVGAIITANAKGKGTFLGGRFLTGLGSACAGASAKSYLAEMAPAHLRGAYMGFLNSFYYIGQMSATGMMIPTGRWASELSWRLPLYIQAVPASINVLFILLCPESPRWLYSVGKSDEARKILANLHSRTRDPNSPLINLEMEEIEEKIQVDGNDKRWWDFRPLFRTRADRYRAYMVILIGSFGQLSGNGMITYFLPVLLQNAGIESQDKRLTLNFVNSVTSYIGALTGSAVIDRFGRRRILLTATGTLVGVLAIVTGLLSDTGELNPMRSNAGITFIYLFMVIFSFGWTPMQALYPAEVLSYEARAKGLAFLGIVAQVASLINTFGLPVALEKLKWKVYLIFLFWDVFEIAIIYLFVVETKGFTLEEIGDIFDHPQPKKYSEVLLNQREEGNRRTAA